MSALLLVGGALVAGGVYLASRKEGDAPSDVAKHDPEEQAERDVGTAVKFTGDLAPAQTTLITGMQVTKSPEGKSVLVEPGFTIENDDGTTECSDAAGGPISCDDLSARVKQLAKISPKVVF